MEKKTGILLVTSDHLGKSPLCGGSHYRNKV